MDCCLIESWLTLRVGCTVATWAGWTRTGSSTSLAGWRRSLSRVSWWSSCHAVVQAVKLLVKLWSFWSSCLAVGQAVSQPVKLLLKFSNCWSSCQAVGQAVKLSVKLSSCWSSCHTFWISIYLSQFEAVNTFEYLYHTVKLWSHKAVNISAYLYFCEAFKL